MTAFSSRKNKVSPEEIGSLLRVAREDLGRTIADAASVTKITKTNLSNMEKGEFSKLPGKPYVIGFTKTYAKYLGLCENNLSEMVRKTHTEYDDSNLQIYKTVR
jgi:cytoskeletal protein RodZ